MPVPAFAPSSLATPGRAPAIAGTAPSRAPGGFLALIGAQSRADASGPADPSPPAGPLQLSDTTPDVGGAAIQEPAAPTGASSVKTPSASSDGRHAARPTHPGTQPGVPTVSATPDLAAVATPAVAALAVAVPANISVSRQAIAAGGAEGVQQAPPGAPAKGAAAVAGAAGQAQGDAAACVLSAAVPGADAAPAPLADDGNAASPGEATPSGPPGAPSASGKPARARTGTGDDIPGRVQAALQPAELASAPSAAPRDFSAGLQPQPSTNDAAAQVLAAASATAPAAGQPAGSAPTPAQTATAPAPTAQLGHAMAALHTGADGSSHVVVRLDPAELGQVQVRITRLHDGAASVSVAVERPDTLRSLQADLGHLHQMLDRAGISDQRSLTLHLAAPETASGAPSGQAGGQESQSGSPFQQQGTRQDRAPTQHAGSGPFADTDNASAVSGQPPPSLRWQRAGINITA